MIPHEKRIRNLPAVRVAESLETAAMRVAARQDRSLSSVVRIALQEYVLAHGESLAADEVEGNAGRASHCDSTGEGRPV